MPQSNVNRRNQDHYHEKDDHIDEHDCVLDPVSVPPDGKYNLSIPTPKILSTCEDVKLNQYARKYGPQCT